MRISILLYLLSYHSIKFIGDHFLFQLAPYKKHCLLNEGKEIPLVIFPGCNDWCPGIDYFQWALEENLNSEIICIEYGPKIESVMNSLELLIERACSIVMKYETTLRHGFNILGFSIGGLIARGILQMCPIGEYVEKLITLGTPHMGIIKVPTHKKSILVDFLNQVTYYINYFSIIQKFVGPTNIVRVVFKEYEFLEKDIFLGKLNNEIDFNIEYRNRFKRLKKLILVGYTEDTYLEPIKSVHFGWFKDQTYSQQSNYNETRLYAFDLLGIRHLHKNNRITEIYLLGRHMNPDVIYSIDFGYLIEAIRY